MRPRVFVIALFIGAFAAGCSKQGADVRIPKDSTQTTSVKDSVKREIKTRETDVSKEISPVEAKYSVGPTTCVIKNHAKVYKVSWADGHTTTLNLLNGMETSITWYEHNEGDTTKLGTFVFHDWNYDNGVYRDKTGKEQPVKRIAEIK